MIGVKSLWDSPLSRKEGDVTTCVSGCQDSARDKKQGMFMVVIPCVTVLVKPSNAFAEQQT